MQIAEHVPAEISTATAQGSSLVQSDGPGQAPGAPGAMPRSQSSPGSTVPSPQVGEQSRSVERVAPAGQHPSYAFAFGVGTVISSWAQTRVQSDPFDVSCVHATPSSQSAGGQAPGSARAMAVSQVSPGSTTPLPQRGLEAPPASASAVPASTTQGPPVQPSCT